MNTQIKPRKGKQQEVRTFTLEGDVQALKLKMQYVTNMTLGELRKRCDFIEKKWKVRLLIVQFNGEGHKLLMRKVYA